MSLTQNYKTIRLNGLRIQSKPVEGMKNQADQCKIYIPYGNKANGIARSKDIKYKDSKVIQKYNEISEREHDFLFKYHMANFPLRKIIPNAIEADNEEEQYLKEGDEEEEEEEEEE